MRIAIFTDVFLGVGGGIASSIKAQKKGLEELGHTVTIFCPGTHKDLNKLSNAERAGVILVPTCRFFRFGGAPLAHNPITIEKWLLKHYPDFPFDIVHAQYEAGCSIAGMRLARKFRRPVFQTMHGREDMAVAYNIPHPFKTFVADQLDWYHSWYIPHKIVVKRDDKWAPTVARARMWTMMVNHANYADFVITPSHHFGRKLKHYGVERPMGVSSNAIAADLPGLSAKVRKYDGKEELLMVWNCRLSREKRVMEFLKCLEKLTIPYRVFMYGEGNDEERARKYAKQKGLKVELMGTAKREVILKKMSECHLGVLTSYGFDNQPMTLLEAEATGMPVLFCDPDMREVVAEGGYILTKGPSAAEMAATINDLGKHPEKIEEMSSAMIKHRHEVFQSEQIKELESLYKKWYSKDIR